MLIDPCVQHVDDRDAIRNIQTGRLFRHRHPSRNLLADSRYPVPSFFESRVQTAVPQVRRTGQHGVFCSTPRNIRDTYLDRVIVRVVPVLATNYGIAGRIQCQPVGHIRRRRNTGDRHAFDPINQFLDIGAGFEPSVHSVAQARNSTARTVYADIDPIVLAHGRALSSDDYTHWIDGDITNPDLALQRSAAAGLDLKQPIALSIVAAAEHIGSHSIAADPLRTWTAELAVGSALVMTQACFDGMSGQTHQAAAVYDHHGITFHPCTLDEFSHYFEGLTLDEPGVGPPHRWASTTCLTLSNSISDEDISCWGAVGRKASLH